MRPVRQVRNRVPRRVPLQDLAQAVLVDQAAKVLHGREVLGTIPEATSGNLNFPFWPSAKFFRREAAITARVLPAHYPDTPLCRL